MKEEGIAAEVSCNDKGELRVTGFDSSGMGKDAVDLMTATETDVTYEGWWERWRLCFWHSNMNWHR